MESLVPLRGNIACHIQYPPTLEAPEHTSSPLQSLQAILFLHDQSKGPDSLERIEELFGVVIDTSLEDDNSQPVWKQEVSALHEDEALRRTVDVVFDDTAKRQKPEYASALNLSESDDILFIRSFRLEPQYRDSGNQYCNLALLAMDSFLEELDKDFEGIIVVQLAGSGCDIGPVGTAVETEQALQELYESHGFKVWVQGDANEERPITIMGS